MKSSETFEDLFILDLANNHQGKVEHAARIIKELGAIVQSLGIKAALKFQFRNLETFIHPSYREHPENKHISRFLSTALSEHDFRYLTELVRSVGMLTMATPFDEASVSMIERLNIELIKIASCSALDWPLLENIVDAGKPVVCSTAGLSLSQIDNLVSFFDHRGVHFALMHCVAIYPTPDNQLNLGRINIFKERYPHIQVGFSTHEQPENYSAIQVAYALGARLFERHVGIATDTIHLNAYSSTPSQVHQWFQNHALAKSMVKPDFSSNTAAPDEEKLSLLSLQRGVYASRDIGAGSKLSFDDTFFAMPLLEGQLYSGKFYEGLIADKNYEAGQSLPTTLLPNVVDTRKVIYKAIHDVKGMLNSSKISVNYDCSVELSHHEGLENFNVVGAVLIDCINREYCKKIIIILPGQTHPAHYHKRKEETFQVLSGELLVEVNGRVKSLLPGDTLVIPRGVWHSFKSSDGAIFEEISTSHFNDDSYYRNKRINKMPREARKTTLLNWGRHQFDDLSTGVFV